jgi:hypothetical protein
MPFPTDYKLNPIGLRGNVIGEHSAALHADIKQILLDWRAVAHGIEPIGIGFLADLGAPVDCGLNDKLVIEFLQFREDGVLNAALQ